MKNNLSKKEKKIRKNSKYEWVFIDGKQVKQRKPEIIDGMLVDEYIMKHADPIWLHQNEMWEYMDVDDKTLCTKKDRKIN
ncbi:MAG: hypothetical protein U9R50_06285 [Campylobacterota bacterium]|nr:hypothetical protein [Campylobacterota bacterium]